MRLIQWIRVSSDRASLATVAAFAASLALAFSVYLPGLSGPFLIDDFARLKPLGNFGSITDLASFSQYIRDAWTTVTGRPLALASFVMDHNTWPAPASDFKYTNLLLHLLNGCLLLAFLLQLLHAYGLSRNRVLFLAVFTCAAWLMHPLLVSTVMYPVQRMTMLSATFVLLGLIAYLAARRRLAERPCAALTAMAAALAIGGGLGMLAKENAALIVPLALVLEATVLPTPAIARPLWRTWRLVVLVAPTAVLLLYLGWRGFEGLGNVPFRDFNSLERVLTQARVLVQYLYYWFIPQGTTPGLFNREITVSRGLLTPATTLPALLLIAAMAAAVVRFRRSLPMVAAPLGFFLAGHLLESTTIPLELYFEHRNYLPSMLLWLPVGLLLLRLPWRRTATAALTVALVAALAGLTHFRATTWGDAELLAMTATRENPDSQRAYRMARYALVQAGKPLKALQVLGRARQELPDNMAIMVDTLLLQCQVGKPDPAIVEAVRAHAQEHVYWPNQQTQYRSLVDTASAEQCEAVDPALARSVLTALLETLVQRRAADHKVASYHLRTAQLHKLMGLLALKQGHSCTAYLHFQRSIHKEARPGRILEEALALTRAGEHAGALALLEQLPPMKSGQSWLGIEPIGGIYPQLADELRRDNRTMLGEQDQGEQRPCR